MSVNVLKTATSRVPLSHIEVGKNVLIISIDISPILLLLGGKERNFEYLVCFFIYVYKEETLITYVCTIFILYLMSFLW